MRIRIHVPLYYNPTRNPQTDELYPAQPISSRYHDAWKRRFLEIFGGVTVYDAEGQWEDEGTLYSDQLEVWEGYVLEHWDGAAKLEAKRLIEDLALKIALDAKQEAVFVAIGEKAFLVSPSPLGEGE